MQLPLLKLICFVAGSHIIPHLPNFNLIDDVVGYLFLHNIVQLGDILDVRRYREGNDLQIWDQDHDFIPAVLKKQYREAKMRSEAILEWLLTHFELALVSGESTDMEEGFPDGLKRADRLLIMSRRFFVQQCRALVLGRWEAYLRNVQGMVTNISALILRLKLLNTAESRSVKARRIRAFIEEAFKDKKWFNDLWPQQYGNSTAEWINSWKENDPRSFAWPPAPQGFSYKMIRI